MTLAQSIIDRNSALVHRYIEAGADVNAIDEYGFTPLIEASVVNDIEIAKILIENGADPKLKDSVGGTPLHWAVENHNLDLCRLFLDHGADPNAYNNSSEPILVKAILREKKDLKELLYHYGAKTRFALDYIHVKLLGHRYDLRGTVDIADCDGNFTELNYEGFFLEFSLNLARRSLQHYINHFSARHNEIDFPIYKAVIHALKAAAELMKYQQYQVDISQHSERIDALLNRVVQIIPVNFQGHAITLIRYNNILVRCDRRKYKQAMNGITFYEIKNTKACTPALFKFLMYERKGQDFIEKDLTKKLGLELVARMMIEPQVTGNCSWANVVACVPAIFGLLMPGGLGDVQGGVIDYQHPAIRLYREWQAWDRRQSLDYCIEAFKNADASRKASMATVIGSVLFQRFHHSDLLQMERAKELYMLLKSGPHDYVIDHYLDHYNYRARTKQGDNFSKLLKACESYF